MMMDYYTSYLNIWLAIIHIMIYMHVQWKRYVLLDKHNQSPTLNKLLIVWRPPFDNCVANLKNVISIYGSLLFISWFTCIYSEKDMFCWIKHNQSHNLHSIIVNCCTHGRNWNDINGFKLILTLLHSRPIIVMLHC